VTSKPRTVAVRLDRAPVARAFAKERREDVPRASEHLAPSSGVRRLSTTISVSAPSGTVDPSKEVITAAPCG